MPRKGNTVESCVITSWKVKEGDLVTTDTAICEVETDKASFEVHAGTAGTVLALLHDPGSDVPVLQPIAVIGESGEDWQSTLGVTFSKEALYEDTKTQSKEEQSKAISSTCASASLRDQKPNNAISPRARNLAAKEALPLPVPGTGPGGRIIERDVTAALQNRPPLTSAAKAAGPGTVPQHGSGLGGRITLADMASKTDIAHHVPDSQLPTLSSHFSGEGAITDTPVKGVRKIIAERMIKSLAGSAQFTLNASTSAVKLQEIRSRIKTQSGFSEDFGLSKITVNDLVLFAVSRILPRFPFMNAHKIGDVIRTFERVHLAVAVDTPKGLMVPVIRNANLLSLAQISSEAKRLAAACQNGSAKPEELSGSTFSVSNLGGYGVSGFTPILNAPEVAILGVCGIEMKALALPPDEKDSCKCGSNCDNNCDCGVRFEPQIGFSLTINHEAVDGAPAARFLKALNEAVAQIDLLLAAG